MAVVLPGPRARATSQSPLARPDPRTLLDRPSLIRPGRICNQAARQSCNQSHKFYGFKGSKSICKETKGSEGLVPCVNTKKIQKRAVRLRGVPEPPGSLKHTRKSGQIHWVFFFKKHKSCLNHLRGHHISSIFAPNKRPVPPTFARAPRKFHRVGPGKLKFLKENSQAVVQAPGAPGGVPGPPAATREKRKKKVVHERRSSTTSPSPPPL